MRGYEYVVMKVYIGEMWAVRLIWLSMVGLCYGPHCMHFGYKFSWYAAMEHSVSFINCHQICKFRNIFYMAYGLYYCRNRDPTKNEKKMKKNEKKRVKMTLLLRSRNASIYNI